MKRAIALTIAVLMVATVGSAAMVAADTSGGLMADTNNTTMNETMENETTENETDENETMENETTENETDENETMENETDEEEELSPGARLGAVVAVSEAEVEGEVSERAYGLKIAKANTPNETTEVVEERVEKVEERLERLSEKKERLKEQYNESNMSEAAYQKQMAKIGTKIENAEDILNKSENATEEVPEEALNNSAVNKTAIMMLKQDAENLSGQEVSEIAQNIAKPDHAGERGPPEDKERGPPEDRGADDEDKERGPPEDRGADDEDKERGPPEDRSDDDDMDGNETTTDENETSTDGNETETDAPPERGNTESGEDGGQPDNAGGERGAEARP